MICSLGIALSGAYVTEEKLKEFIDAGVDRIYVSLNGSTKEINEKTRDGYELAINTLELLKKIGFNKQTLINWVMHVSNSDDFPGMISLAEKYELAGMVILGFKPDSSHELKRLSDGRADKEGG
jgi:Predicted Fe-S oxidoreductases